MKVMRLSVFWGLYFDLSDVLRIRHVLDFYHEANFVSGPEVELLFFAINVEADFSSPNINLCSRSAQERSPKDERRFFRGFHVEHHKVDRDKVTPDFYRNIFGYPCWLTNRRIGQLELHWHW
jgi:hypothetical protein